MKNRGRMIKILLLTGLLVFADVNLDFTSVNLYAAEASAGPETEEAEEKTTQVSENNTQESMDWNLVFLIMLAAVTGATVAIYGTSKKK